MKLFSFLKHYFFYIVVFILLSICHLSFAYDEVIVHPLLTSEMAKLYNLNYAEKLTDQEIDWMKKGSKDEDERQGLLIRSGNHFYNPFGIKKWADNTFVGNIVPEPKLTAKEWAHDSLEQDSFPGGDFTWERGIWDYVNGDKQHAYESLGHILHLIEDSTVPAHTRNDLHISPNDKDLAPYQNLPHFEEIKKALQDGEPYESWTGAKAWSQNLKFDFAGNLFQEKKPLLALNNIDEYFDNIAKYTNTKFFSKDTIYAYLEPNNKITAEDEIFVDSKILRYAYGTDENNQKYKLAAFVYEQNNISKKIDKKYIVSDDTPEIHSDYWSRLGPRAVLTGAGIIKLFKTEANKAAQNPQAVARPKSIASVYGPLTPAVKATDPTIRQIATAGQLLANMGIYSVKSAVAYLGNSVSQYFPSSSAKAELEFDISNSASDKIYTIKELIEKAKEMPIAKAEEKNEPFYAAKLFALNQNQNQIFLAGQEIKLSAEIKNTGGSVWQGEKISLNIYTGENLAKQFYHSSWLTAVRPASLGKAKIDSGAVGVFNFIVAAPSNPGDYFFRARAVRQSEYNEFNWLGDDIASWLIRVKAPEIIETDNRAKDGFSSAEDSEDKENALPLEEEKTEDSAENNLPAEEKYEIEDAADKDKEAARLAEEEAARLEQEEEERIVRRRRASAWLTIPPETTILEFPENPTLETTAIFKFSSTKANSTFLCSLDDSEFVFCGEYAIFENLAVGEYILKVKAKDAFGNIDETPAEYSWMIEKAESSLTPAHNITSGLDYPSIQWAIDSASAGDEIQVDSGTYYENVNVNKQLILKGIDTGGGKPIVDANGNGSAITISANGSANGSAVEGFNAINSDDSKSWHSGIEIRSDNNSVKNNNVSNNYYGIYLINADNNTISGNIADSNAYDGIILSHSNHNTVDNNIASSNSYGIQLSDDSYYNTVSNNIATFNLNAGFFIGYGYENTLNNNTAKSNAYGIFIFSGGRNKIYHNNFIDNSQYNVDDRSGIANIWDDGYPSGGNYWSDYGGIDFNSGANQDQPGSDGIGDTVYSITCNNFNTCGGRSYDQYPLMRQFNLP